MNAPSKEAIAAARAVSRANGYNPDLAHNLIPIIRDAQLIDAEFEKVRDHARELQTLIDNGLEHLSRGEG